MALVTPPIIAGDALHHITPAACSDTYRSNEQIGHRSMIFAELDRRAFDHCVMRRAYCASAFTLKFSQA